MLTKASQFIKNGIGFYPFEMKWICSIHGRDLKFAFLTVYIYEIIKLTWLARIYKKNIECSFNQYFFMEYTGTFDMFFP
jgi:hypothetical protein